MAKEEMVLQGMIDKLIEFCRRYGMEINVGKNKRWMWQEDEEEEEDVGSY